MMTTKYIDAVAEAQRELRSLQKEHATLLKKIDALQSFISSGLALTGTEQLAPEAGIGTTISVQVPSISGAQIPLQVPSVSGAQILPQNGIAIADQVAMILRSAGRPLHMKEIARQLLTVRSMASKKPERTIFTAMKRRKNLFRKVKPNTYSLVASVQ